MSKIQEALEKLEKECEKDINDNNTVMIANYLRDIVSKSELNAVLVLDSAKTISGAINAMYEVAQKRKKTNNMVMIGPEDGFNIINKYYGFGGSTKAEILPQVAAPPEDEVVSLLDLI